MALLVAFAAPDAAFGSLIALLVCCVLAMFGVHRMFSGVRAADVDAVSIASSDAEMLVPEQRAPPGATVANPAFRVSTA